MNSAYTNKASGYFKNKRAEMLKFVPPQCSKFLEIGCGDGSFGRQIKSTNKQVEYWGIDLDDNSITEAANNIDQALAGDINVIIENLPENYFDCIVMNDVLEHLMDPMEVLLGLESKIKPNALLVASIPNVRYITNLFNLILKRDWEYTDYGILDKTHLKFFTKKSIIRFFQSKNFEIQILEGINPIKSWIVSLANCITLGFFNDTRYLQFAVLAAFPKK